MKKILYVLLFALLIISCKTDNTNPPANNTVTIKDDFFDPAEITVSVGRTIVWKSEGQHQHTVTSGTPTVNPGLLFDSGPINNGEGFTFSLNAPGTYQYFCRVHGINMSGTIIVQ